MYVPVPRRFEGHVGVVMGTGPSFTPAVQRALKTAWLERDDLAFFGVNCMYQDFFPIDVLMACDPLWWERYGPDPVLERFAGSRYTWSPDVHRKFPYTELVEGRWGDGLSTDPAYIHYGHSSGYQALNLAVLMGCSRILLVGYDMRYPQGKPRHYFDKLSATVGEYPPELRKWSTFEGLLRCYESVARQPGLPPIINCTVGSAMTCFPMGCLTEELLR